MNKRDMKAEENPEVQRIEFALSGAQARIMGSRSYTGPADQDS